MDDDRDLRGVRLTFLVVGVVLSILMLLGVLLKKYCYRHQAMQNRGAVLSLPPPVDPTAHPATSYPYPGVAQPAIGHPSYPGVTQPATSHPSYPGVAQPATGHPSYPGVAQPACYPAYTVPGQLNSNPGHPTSYNVTAKEGLHTNPTEMGKYTALPSYESATATSAAAVAAPPRAPPRDAPATQAQ